MWGYRVLATGGSFGLPRALPGEAEVAWNGPPERVIAP